MTGYPAVLAAVVAAAVMFIPTVADAQDGAIPQTVLNAQTAAMTRSQLDSACLARALPVAGTALFAGLRDALSRARAADAPLLLSPAAATLRAVTVTAAWYLVLVFIGLAVLAFAGDRLRQVTETLEHDTASSLLTGLVAGLASLPLLVAAVVILALTIIGLLLIPFAVVAMLLAYAGVAVLGFLAVASVTGRALLGDRKSRMTERTVALMGLLAGLALLLIVWLAAALFTWSPAVGLVLRSMALGLTAVAITAGVGAVIRSFKARDDRAPVAAVRADEMAWQTPTPVGGVVAVRRSSS